MADMRPDDCPRIGEACVDDVTIRPNFFCHRVDLDAVEIVEQEQRARKRR